MTVAPQSPWRTGWFFACPAVLLADDQRHLTIDLPELSITIQNYRGGLSGFWNVCSHRAVQMRMPGLGQGALRCPYHGWTYNAEGVPIGIPDNEELFGLDAEAKRALALRPIGIAVTAGAVFVRIEPDGSQPEAAWLEPAELAGASQRHRLECRLPVGQPPPADSATLGNLSVQVLGDFALLGWVLPDGRDSVLANVALYALADAPETVPAEAQAAYDRAARGLEQAGA